MSNVNFEIELQKFKMSGGGGNNGNSNIEETTLNAGNVMDKMLKLFEPPGGYPGERYIILFEFSNSYLIAMI